MKSLLKITLLSSAIALALVGCDDKKENTAPAATQTEANTSSAEVKVDITPAKEAYALGASYGDYLSKNLERNKVDLDKNEIIKGFGEGFKGKSSLTEKEIQYILTELDKRLQKEAQDRFEQEKTKSIEEGDKYREEFAKQDGVKQTESGLLYQIIEEGSDNHPTIDDTVVVHYKGTLVDGTQFDSSYDRAEPSKFPLKGVVEGWQEGIQLIGVGGKIKLVVPPELAYGERGQANIPASSTLVFEVELLGIDSDESAQTPAAQVE